MLYVLKSLVAATATGAGVALTFDSPRRSHFNYQVSWTGSPSSVVVTLEITVDGTNWVTWATFTSNGTTPPSGSIQGGDIGPIMGARLNLTTLSGGSSPTVSATYVQVEAVG